MQANIPLSRTFTPGTMSRSLWSTKTKLSSGTKRPASKFAPVIVVPTLYEWTWRKPFFTSS